jgi:Arc/MetJ-type ribon-helix-helix transcriptional regulator
MPQEEPLEVQNSIFLDYIQTRKHCCRNMEKMVTSGEYKKASEYLWEAITQSIKALASVSSIPTQDHGFSRNIILQVFEEINDNEYHQLFLYLQKLHQNFNHREIEAIEFPSYLEKANTFLEKTDYLIQMKKKEIGGSILNNTNLNLPN